MHEPPGPKRDSIKQDFAGKPRRKTVMGWNSSTVCAEHDILPSSMVWPCVKKTYRVAKCKYCDENLSLLHVKLGCLNSQSMYV